MPVVVIAPNDALLEKVKSNMQEVRARGGQVYVFADLDSHFSESEGVHVIRTPRHVECCRLFCTPSRCSYWPIIPPCSRAPMWTNLATLPSRSRSSDLNKKPAFRRVCGE